MGQVSILTKEQQAILGEFARQDWITSNFYFTGGTALSEYYLQHRYSDDLDFFNPIKFDGQALDTIIMEISQRLGFSYRSRFNEVVYSYFFTIPDKTELKVDFGYYPYRCINKPIHHNGIWVDDLQDIATNKLLTISQRTDVKDFVDLYYLIDRFSLWNLINGVEVKFRREIDTLILPTDFMKVEDFTVLPRMIKPLTLEQLKKFFREKAIELGRQAVEE